MCYCWIVIRDLTKYTFDKILDQILPFNLNNFLHFSSHLSPVKAFVKFHPDSLVFCRLLDINAGMTEMFLSNVLRFLSGMTETLLPNVP